jgi:hypothetical protein
MNRPMNSENQAVAKQLFEQELSLVNQQKHNEVMAKLEETRRMGHPHAEAHLILV